MARKRETFREEMIRKSKKPSGWIVSKKAYSRKEYAGIRAHYTRDELQALAQPLIDAVAAGALPRGALSGEGIVRFVFQIAPDARVFCVRNGRRVFIHRAFGAVVRIVRRAIFADGETVHAARGLGLPADYQQASNAVAKTLSSLKRLSKRAKAQKSQSPLRRMSRAA